MDGFDDLLAPSRRALEDNPFENPFAQPRSSSPDPWASYSHNPFGEPAESHPEPEFEPEPEPKPATPEPTDPLESASVNHPDYDEPTSPSPPQTPTAKTPGFRESAPSPETLKKPELSASEPAPSTPTSPISERQQLIHSPTLASNALSSPTDSPRPSSNFSRPDAVVVSPLEPTNSAFENSFASLALGGESMGGGWQSTHSNFVNGNSLPVTREPSMDDDDDEEDNRPVLQSPRFKAKEKEKEIAAV
jgi:sorting nexin-1/2